MLSVYKGRYVICKGGTIFNKYFINVLKKLPFNLYFCKLYKKNTQYYNIKALLYLSKYVDILVKRVTVSEGTSTFLLSNIKSLKHSKQTQIVRCLSKQDNTYVGCPLNVLKLIKLKITKFYGVILDINLSQIGFSLYYNK